MRRQYVPGQMGPRSIVPHAHGLKRVYLELFGIPDVRPHLTASYALRALTRIPFVSLLDVGCGNGVVTCFLGSRYPGRRIVGVDRDEAGLEFARALARQNGLANVSFERTNIESDRLTGEFDLITCFAVMQFIHDCHRLIRRLHDLLAPQGHLLLQLPTANRVAYLAEAWPERNCYPDFHEARGPFHTAEARQLVEKNSFDLVRLTEVLKGPTVLAKELFYLTLFVSRALTYACCPMLNWITSFDACFGGPGNGLFLLARKST